MCIRIQFEQLLVEAISVGGMYTCIQIPQLQLIFDIGVCPNSAFSKKSVFLTHNHIDHMAGTLRHCATRELMRMGPPTYYMDHHYIDAFSDLLNSARRLNHAQMPCEIVGIGPNERIVLDKQFSIHTFRSIHRVPCIGYTVIEKRQKLKSMYSGFSGQQLAALKKENVEITNEMEIPIFCYPGDTSIGVLKKEELARKAKLLFIELTFIDDRVSQESAQSHGHIHIDDIRQNEELFSLHQHIVFMHFSSRYKAKEIRETLKNSLPKSIIHKCYFLPNNSIFEPSTQPVELMDIAILPQ